MQSQRESADTCVRSLLTCKGICHNAPTDDINYEKCHGEGSIPSKLAHFFHAVGIEYVPVA
jgi:hypothetical protein